MGILTGYVEQRGVGTDRVGQLQRCLTIPSARLAFHGPSNPEAFIVHQKTNGLFQAKQSLWTCLSGLTFLKDFLSPIQNYLFPLWSRNQHCA